MDELFTWYPVSRVPTLKIDERPDLIMVATLESGYLTSAEYDHEAKTFIAYCERFSMEMSELGLARITPDLIDQNLDWEAEETKDIAYWMWLLRPSFGLTT